MVKPLEATLMFIGYIDDSGSTGMNLADPESQYQVIGGPVVRGYDNQALETILTDELSSKISDQAWEDFEFHASDMFYARGEFKELGIEKCHDLLQESLQWIETFGCPILCGAINKWALRDQVYQSARPLDMAFRLYLKEVNTWITKGEGSGDILLISDSFQSKKQGGFQKQITETFYSLRKNPSTSGQYQHLFSDIYFGDSKRSFGIQMADVCCYFVARHLSNHADSEPFYKIIENLVQPFEVFPNED